ncbi:MAG: hypothetical protein ACRELY_09620 [Polyangiaceae bacterium]
MLDVLRTKLHEAMTNTKGDSVAAVRASKSFARRANAMLGLPLCSSEELATRKAASEKLRNLREKGAVFEPTKKAAAPVTIYFEKDRNARELARIEELLQSKGYAFTKRDVAGDESTLDFVMRTAKCKGDDLPVVFVAAEAIGSYTALVAADVSGELAKKIGA